MKKKLTRIDFARENLEKAVANLEESLERLQNYPILRETIEKSLEKAKEVLELLKEVSE